MLFINLDVINKLQVLQDIDLYHNLNEIYFISRI